MRSKISVICGILLSVSLSGMFVHNQKCVYCAQQSAVSFVETIGDDVLAVMKKHSTEKERCTELHKKLQGKVNFEQLAKASLTKKYYQDALKSEPNFLKYFENMAIKYVVSIMQKYDASNARFNVTKRVQKIGKNQRVASRITINEVFNVNWLISSDLKIIDIVAEGVSLKGILKTQVYDVIRKQGLNKFLKDFAEKYKD